MKKLNLTIIASIIASFVISMFALQPVATEASNNALPTATPVQVKKRIKKRSSNGLWEDHFAIVGKRNQSVKKSNKNEVSIESLKRRKQLSRKRNR